MLPLGAAAEVVGRVSQIRVPRVGIFTADKEEPARGAEKRGKRRGGGGDVEFRSGM